MATPPNQNDDEDPWKPVLSSPAAQDSRPDIGDTRTMLRIGSGLEVGEVASADDTDVASDIAVLLTQTLRHQPHRVDLWMMRFEVYRAQGMKAQFAAAVYEALAARLGPALDWHGVTRLWQELAPDEPLPTGMPPAPVPSATAPPPAPAPAPATAPASRTDAAAPPSPTLPPSPRPPPRPPSPPAAPGRRRFSDFALQTAPRALDALTQSYRGLRARPDFYDKFLAAISPMLQRPSPLQRAEFLPGVANRLFLKREDRREVTPAFENAVAQAWVAKALGKSELVVASEYEGHARAVAAVAARLHMPCTAYLSRADFTGQPRLVQELEQLGCSLQIAAEADARYAALRHWQSVPGCHFAQSLGAGPHPYPAITSDFQSLLGRETEAQYRALGGTAAPAAVLAARDSRADALGFLLSYLSRPQVALYCLEAPASAGGEGRGPWSGTYRERRREHAWLRGSGRLHYVAIDDADAHRAQDELQEHEGIAIALDDARALAQAQALARSGEVAGDLLVLLA